MSSTSGTLWIVATPLGNPGDLSPRARDTLSAVDGILSEDTRRTGALFARIGLNGPPMTSFHEHNEEGRIAQAIARLEDGRSLALVSDAGTPLLSDPGYRLVKACRERGIAVKPVPGPSAPVAALSAAGLPPYPFSFIGFAPRKDAEREAFFASYANVPGTLVFFERKDRLAATLACALRVLGPREACVARELTKPYEEFLLFPLEDFASALPDELLGELTVLLGPAGERARTPWTEVAALLREESVSGGKAKDIAKRVQLRVAGWSSKELYQRLRELSEGDGA